MSNPMFIDICAKKMTTGEWSFSRWYCKKNRERRIFKIIAKLLNFIYHWQLYWSWKC